jgi:Tol biopolymer transport system component
VRYVFTADRPVNPDIFKVIAATVSPIFTVAGVRSHPSVAWDRSACVFQNGTSGNCNIMIVDLPSGQARALTGPGDDRDPEISPDGVWVAFTRYGTGPGRIWLMLSDGSAARPLTPGTADEVEPTWSEDGSAVYYSSYAAGSYNIYRIDVATGSITRITTEATDERDPTMRGAHEELIYSGNATGSYKLYWKDARALNTPATQITTGAGDDTDPCWPHPGGTKILYTNVNGGVSRIMDLEVYPLGVIHAPAVVQTTDNPREPGQ